MPITADVLSITTSPTEIGRGLSTTDFRTVGFSVPSGGATVFIGGTDVTTANGFPWTPTDGKFFMDLAAGDILYGIVAAGSQNINRFRNRS